MSGPDQKALGRDDHRTGQRRRSNFGAAMIHGACEGKLHLETTNVRRKGFNSSDTRHNANARSPSSVGELVESTEITRVS